MKKLVLGASLALLSINAFAYKECTVETSRLYIGDDGHLWLQFINGGLANMKASDIDFEHTYSLLLAAQMADKKVTVRFKDDNAQCNSGTRSDIVGVWVHR
ncbi:hypothetical protein HG263_16550 [Pseudoalteromonas sp. JBTF-M23]|uniref:Uncharacterized protein n=1 Tax=Pseudoalteromonas caenipelagi TaxID=2726988 RepID=A0A849VKA6_9GAMM|nr:hypothetical protein [Pseudoalteromonas caenipelagi]NOU52141.1 hypothetical protein [Pseudoalteromonas caenipelagi]